jgi:hypothetical protein
MHLKEHLINLKFNVSKYDKCLFYKEYKGQKCYVGVHVDDLLVVTQGKEAQEEFQKEFSLIFRDITFNSEDIISYLGMNIRKTDRILLDQRGYIDSLMERLDVRKKSPIPSNNDLFKKSVGEDIDPKIYKSTVMSLMFLATRTRPDILKETIHLSSVTDPNTGDWKKVERVLAYINQTRNMCLEFNVTSLQPVAYIDAAYNVHDESKSHTGTIISLGPHGGTIYAKSSKQKITATSSTEAELVAVHTGMRRAMIVQLIVQELTGEYNPILLLQDNQSTIKLIENNHAGSFKSKHINVRYFSIRENVEAEEVIVQYLPTNEMKADLLTKPMGGEQFQKMRDWVQNVW